MTFIKKFSAYFHYYFYLGWNWNFRLATIILIHEIKGERKYKISSIGIDNLLNIPIIDDERENISIYQPINYFIAEWLFSQVPPADIKNAGFLDAGCGKGRALVMAAHFGFREIYGFDISENLLAEAQHNIDQTLPDFPNTKFYLSLKNAREYPISDHVGVIFLFNPFDKYIMNFFIKRVQESLDRVPRKMILLYANPECKNQWIISGFKEINSIRKLNWLQGSILEYQP